MLHSHIVCTLLQFPKMHEHISLTHDMYTEYLRIDRIHVVIICVTLDQNQITQWRKSWGGGASAAENDKFSEILTYKRAKNSLFECKWGGGFVGNLKVLSEI
jgi:hypothetical protein